MTYKNRSISDLRTNRIFLLHLLLFSIIWSQTNSTAIMGLSPDAFSQSIGGPNEAFSVGAADIFINPALLTNHSYKEIQLSNLLNSNYLNYMNSAFSIPLTKTDFIGVGIFSLNIPVLRYYNLDELDVSEYDAYFLNFTFGYARKLSFLSLGIALKNIRFGFEEAKLDNQLRAFEFDIGAHLELKHSLDLGIVYKQILSKSNKWALQEMVPNRLGVSFSWEPVLITENFLTVLLGTDILGNKPILLNYGLVLTPYSRNGTGITKFSLRAGIGNSDFEYMKFNKDAVQLFKENELLKIGLGLGISPAKSWGLNLDYCFQYDEFTENQHIITTRFRF